MPVLNVPAFLTIDMITKIINKIVVKRSLYTPLAALMCIVIATVSAFASQRLGQSNNIHIGHKSVGLKCIPTEVSCTDLPTGVVCRDNQDKALYLHIGPISCANQLWRPTP